MIIPDDNLPPPKGDSAAQQPIFPALPESPSPPRPPPPPYTNYPTTSPYVVPAPFVEPEEPAGRRFVRAFLVAVAVWVLAGIFVSSAVDLHRSIRWAQNIVKGNAGTPSIEDGNIDHCVPWTRVSGREHPRLGSGAWSRASVDLPTDAGGLYLISRGARASGTLRVSESREAKDVSVKVFVNHPGPETHSHASVCQLNQDGGRMGVGIFAPFKWHIIPWLGRGSNLRFVVEVELPLSRGAVRYLPSFRADLPMFALAMDDLSAFHFGDFALKSSNNEINVEAVIANSVEIHTTNGGIRGAFNTSDDLTLITTNLPISVRVGAANGGFKKSTNVLMHTINAHIEADISLKSKSSSGTGGSFGVHARTTNGFIKIVYDDSPVDSVLNSNVRSANAPVHVALHRAYEGTFSLRTTNSPASLDQLRHIEDPSGRGRKRVLSNRSTNGHVVYGQVEWSPSSRDGRAGSVDVSTTNAFAQLSL